MPELAARPAGVFTGADWPAGIPGATTSRRRFGPDVVELACEVLVIGSGAGGATVAAELAEAGRDVVVVEEGGYHSTEEFTAEAGAMIRKLYRDGGVQAALGTPPVSFVEGRCVGGSTVINGGMSWRTPERVLDRWVREEGVAGADPAAMEPVFERVERMISVAHQDPWTIGRDNALLREGAEAKGWGVVPNLRNQLHCAGTNNCAFGCPTGAKRSTLVSYLPRALHFGARVLADCRVERLLTRRKRIEGAAGRVRRPDGRPGPRFRIRAGRTIVACGAIQTPALLSRSGVRSPSGRLGHNLSLHPNTKVVALFDEDVKGWQGVHQAYQVREFEDEGFVMAAINLPPSLVAMSLPAYGRELVELLRDYDRTVVAGVLIEDTVTGRVRTVAGQPVPTYALSERDRERIVRATALVCEAMFAAGAKRILLPFEGVPDLRSPDDVPGLYAARVPLSAMEVVTVHLMGTAPIGGDRTRHVCDPWGKVHDADGLYVADASLFPTPIGVNPMETIMALATRAAARLLDEAPA